MKVVIHKNTLRSFKRRAWNAYPLELIEAMFGDFCDNGFEIHLFSPVEHKATTDDVVYNHDPKALEEEAKDTNLKFLGYIHTHPGKDTCKHLSDCDKADSIEVGEFLTGICHLFPGKRHYAYLHFEVPNPSIDIEISKL